MSSPVPPLRVYGRPGCHLCEQTRLDLDALISERRASGLVIPEIEERDITADPGWERAYLETIPVLELGGHELPLATSPTRVRRLLADVLDSPVAHAT